MGKAHSGVASGIAHHQRSKHPGEGQELLPSLSGSLGTWYGVCNYCGNLETNVNRHEQYCRRRSAPRKPDPKPSTPRVQGTLSTGEQRFPRPDSSQENPNTHDDDSPSPLLPWGLEDVREALDSVPTSEIECLSFSTAKIIRHEHRQLFGTFFRHAVQLFTQAWGKCTTGRESDTTQADRDQLNRAVKLLHVTPALLQSTDGRIARQQRYDCYAQGNLTAMLSWLVSFAKQTMPSPSADDPATRRTRAGQLAHCRGGVSKAASLLTAQPAPPRNGKTLEILRSKHPFEFRDEVNSGRLEAEAILSDGARSSSGIREVEDPFSTESVSATIRRANPQSAPGPSGLRYCHLQQAMSIDLVEALSDFSRVVFQGDLPNTFWRLHTSANLSAIGEKARPVACGDVLRRLIGGTVCRQYGQAISEKFEPVGQYGVATPGGTEIMTTRANLAYQQGYAIVTFDARNAFNSMKRRQILPAMATIIPPVVPYVNNVYAREPPRLLFRTQAGKTEVIESHRGVQQGCALGPLCYSAGSLQLLKDFRDDPPVEGALMMAYIDDLVILLPPEHATSAQAIARVTTWLQKRLEPLGVELNRSKSHVLLPQGTSVATWSEEDQTVLSRTQLTVASEGVKVVGVPVGHPEYVKAQVGRVVHGEPAELCYHLAQMEDAQASFQILRLSAATRMHSLLRALPPSVTKEAAKEFDSLLEWTLASIVNGQGAPRDGLATPQEVQAHPGRAATQPVLSPEAVRQARLPVREGGLGLSSALEVGGPAFIGCQALVLARAVVAASNTGLEDTLAALPTTSHAQELRRELQRLTDFASAPQIASMVGTSWTALALDKDPANRGAGTLLVEAGANGASPAGEATEPAEAVRQEHGAATEAPQESSDQEIPGLGGRPSSETGTIRQAQSRISRVMYAAKGKKLLEDLKANTDTAEGQRAYMRFAGARGKGAMAWATSQGTEQREKVEPDIFREVLARNLGSHDRDTPFGARCHEGCDTAPSPVHTLTCTRGGMQTNTHQAILHGFFTQALRECKIPHEKETQAPFLQGTGNGTGYLRMDVVVNSGCLLTKHDEYKLSPLMFDVTVANPLGPSTLARSQQRTGFALEEAVKAKHIKYGGKCRPTYKLIPLAFSTCGDYSSSVHDLIKDMGRLRAEVDDEYMLAGEQGKVALQARETGRLRRRLSIVVQKALAYRTLRYVGRQQVSERR